MQSELTIFLPILIFIVAILYASVGHGGASGYLALMSIFSFSVPVMKFSALVMNVFVASISFWYYYREGYFKKSLFIPFAIASIPCAYLGATLDLDPTTYKRVLGVLLIFPILRLFGFFGKDPEETNSPPFIWAMVAGMIIGTFSGMIGIGGGIILSPVILLFRWGNMKETAAVSALFIAVNSLAGIAGVYREGIIEVSNLLYLLIPALAGGFIGSFLGSKKLNVKILKPVLGFVLLLACIKLITL